MHNKNTGWNLEKSAPYFYFSLKVRFRSKKQGISKNNAPLKLNKEKIGKSSERIRRFYNKSLERDKNQSIF